MLLVDGVDPVGAKRQLAFLYEVGNQGHDGGDFSAAKLGDLLEGVALFEEFHGFLRGTRRLRVPFLGGAFAFGESAEGIEDFFSVEFTLFFASVGDLAE